MKPKQLISIAGHVIDPCGIERIGPIFGGDTWLRYTVFFKNGSHIDVYEQAREGSFPREQLIKIWEQAINN